LIVPVKLEMRTLVRLVVTVEGVTAGGADEIS
jgi:hypothetical protein